MRRCPLVIVGFLALAGCGSAGIPTASAPTTSVAPPTTAAAVPYRFARHGFEVDVPPGWHVNEHDGTWSRVDQFGPDGQVPGEDVVASPDGASFLVANAMTIPPGMTVAAWRAAFSDAVTPLIPASCSPATGSAVIGGEPASVLDQGCPDEVLVGRSLVYRGRGYYFTTRAPAGDATLAVLDEIVDSIRFTEHQPAQGCDR